MLTPSADNRLPKGEPVVDDTIPAELFQLDQRLLTLGTAWRTHPAVARLASYAQKLPPDPGALDSTAISPDLTAGEAFAQNTAPITAPVKEITAMSRDATSPNTRPRRVSPKVHPVLASVAAVLIVGLLVATFAVFSHRSTSLEGAQPTATSPASTATAVTPPRNRWATLPSLSSTTTFALAAPAIAPSDPQIVYKVTDSPHLALQRTDNDGVTWQTYSLPVTNASNFMQVYVSPLNPNVLVLHTDGWTTPPPESPGPQGNVGVPHTDSSITSSTPSTTACNFESMSWVGTTTNNATTSPLADLSPRVPTGPFLPCSQFESTNGGKSWTQSSDFFDSARIVTAGGQSAGLFMVQGNRLYTYEGFACESATGVCGGGLLVSLDGGITWRPAPTPSSGSFCGVGMAPTGSLMFAITTSQCGQGNVPSDNTIWRSEDAGEHWAPVSHLQFSALDDLRVVLNPATGTPTVFLTASNLADVTTPQVTRTTSVQMSQDGGQTWSAVPTGGIPTGWSALDVVAQTSDGSAIALFGQTGGTGAELYSSLPGGSSWLPIAPAPSSSPVMYLVTSSRATSAGTDLLWAVSVSLATVGGTPFTSEVYRLPL